MPDFFKVISTNKTKVVAKKGFFGKQKSFGQKNGKEKHFGWKKILILLVGKIQLILITGFLS